VWVTFNFSLLFVPFLEKGRRLVRGWRRVDARAASFSFFCLPFLDCVDCQNGVVVVAPSEQVRAAAALCGFHD